MPEDFEGAVGHGGDAQAIIDAATRAAAPHPIGQVGEFSRFYSVATANGDVRVIDLEDYLDKHRDRPHRKTGTVRVQDAASFVAYLTKHSLPETEVWADVAQQRLVAVINAHAEVGEETNSPAADEYAGWGDHRAELDLRKTPAWQAWADLDRKWLGQTEFAEHLEDRLVDVVSPAAADMLELAQTFQATIGVSFESSKQLASGERQLEYKETVEAKAGRRGHLSIPKEFELGLAPFEGGAAYKVTARFRYRISDGALRVGFILDRPEDVLRHAFLDIVTEVDAAADAPVFRGTPGTPGLPG